MLFLSCRLAPDTLGLCWGVCCARDEGGQEPEAEETAMSERGGVAFRGDALVSLSGMDEGTEEGTCPGGGTYNKPWVVLYMELGTAPSGKFFT